MNTLEQVQAAVADQKLLPGAAENIRAFLSAGLPAWAQASIAELVERGEWRELNDRFHRHLEFGTGGMRGRTIGAVQASAETGMPGPTGEPGHAAIGSNMLNDFTLLRATIGLQRYMAKYLKARGSAAKPRIVIACDVRHFSRHFTELAASAWMRLGGEAFIFGEPRPTPQLSFSVRWLKAHAGVVITASHNPPHDNGFKAYFEDGAQVVRPHDTGIVAEVSAVPLSELGPFLEKDLSGVEVLGRNADDAYLATAALAALDTEAIRKARPRIVFTNLHGTGAVHSVPLLIHAGCAVEIVPEQFDFDARFPTVKSANPEDPEALSRAVGLAERDGFDAVLATDPDGDRMGCAVRNREGRMELLTGNQVGALLTEYRLAKFKEMGWIPHAGSDRVRVIKTFVTTRLQDMIAAGHGVKVINTLTGFKWIAAKLHAYEKALAGRMPPGFDPDKMTFAARARLQLEKGTFYAFGSEESYGYLPNDWVRDKDANAACLMMAELCACAKNCGETVPEYLDRIYVRHGYYREGTINLYYEGASGGEKIGRILDSYRSNPPWEFGGRAVRGFQDFGRQRIVDSDGEEIPKQDLYILTLDDGFMFAARGSGTEPKMKFYLFANEKVDSLAGLPAAKARVKAYLDSMGSLIEADARRRAEG